MLSKEAAKKIGIDACADKLGRDFILAHKNYAISIYGESADSVYCFVGVEDGIPRFEECVLPPQSPQ